MINTDKCIGCALYTKDCIVNDIVMIEGKSHIKNEKYVKCGHCIAICPVGAISSDDEKEYLISEVKEYNDKYFSVDPDVLMNFMKFRRSVRLFSNKYIEKKDVSITRL